MEQRPGLKSRERNLVLGNAVTGVLGDMVPEPPKKKVSADVFRPASPHEEIIINTDTLVTVKLQADDVTREVWIEVSVKSLVRPGLWGHGKIDADDRRLEYKVQAMAELLANQQCLAYGDRHNPGAVAAAALEAYRDIRTTAEKARLGRGNG